MLDGIDPTGLASALTFGFSKLSASLLLVEVVVVWAWSTFMGGDQ